MQWNKIEVGKLNIIIKDNNPLYLKIVNDVKLEIIVESNVCSQLFIIANCNYEIRIKLKRQANLVVNSLNKDNNSNINIDLSDSSCITYNHSTLNNNESENYFNINHLENNSISSLNNNGINRGNKLYFIINGVVPKELNNIICNQKSKIINLKNSNSKIIPNLIIDSNDIVANHSAYIGEIDQEIRFYMQTRGVGNNDLEKVIYKATLLGTMNLSIENDEFKKIIDEWW